MTTEIYRNGMSKIEIKSGVVTFSDSDPMPIGSKKDGRRLAACGWKKVKAVI